MQKVRKNVRNNPVIYRPEKTKGAWPVFLIHGRWWNRDVDEREKILNVAGGEKGVDKADHISPPLELDGLAKKEVEEEVIKDVRLDKKEIKDLRSEIEEEEKEIEEEKEDDEEEEEKEEDEDVYKDLLLHLEVSTWIKDETGETVHWIQVMHVPLSTNSKRLEFDLCPISLDEEALKEVLEEEARAEKERSEWEEEMKKEQAHDELFSAPHEIGHVVRSKRRVVLKDISNNPFYGSNIEVVNGVKAQGRRVRKEEVDVVDVKGLRRVVVVQRVRDMVKVVADRCIEKVLELDGLAKKEVEEEVIKDVRLDKKEIEDLRSEIEEEEKEIEEEKEDDEEEEEKEDQVEEEEKEEDEDDVYKDLLLHPEVSSWIKDETGETVHGIQVMHVPLSTNSKRVEFDLCPICVKPWTLDDKTHQIRSCCSILNNFLSSTSHNTLFHEPSSYMKKTVSFANRT
ncbi:hypothetical protein Tco_0935289 [Tanacetum coccineum]